MDTMKYVNIHLEDKRVSRKFFLLIWIMYTVVYMTKNCFSSAMAMIVAEGILTKSQTGFITAAFYFVYAPLQIVGGIAVDKYSPEKLITIGLAGGAVANAVIYFNHNYYVMLAAWVFNAIIQLGVWPGIFKIFTSQLCRSDRPIMVFFMSLTSTAGLFLGFLVAAVLPGWEYNFILSALALGLFAITFYIASKKVSRYMKPDYTEPELTGMFGDETYKGSTFKLFLVSGFIVMIPVAIIREIVAMSVKTLTPTMLMENYDTVSASFGNILNLLVVASGLIGVFIVKQFIFPKLIHDENLAYLPCVLITIPFLVIIRFIGSVSVAMIVLSMCVVSLGLSVGMLLNSHYNMRFVRFGKNGTAAGISNAAASFGIVLQNYAVLKIADSFGWGAVTDLWLILTIILPFLLLVVYFQWKRFAKRQNIKKAAR